MSISELQQKIQKRFFVSEVIPFELVGVNSHYYKGNMFYRQSLCQPTVLRFQMALR